MRLWSTQFWNWIILNIVWNVLGKVFKIDIGELIFVEYAIFWWAVRYLPRVLSFLLNQFSWTGLDGCFSLFIKIRISLTLNICNFNKDVNISV